jgi:hypothetical protein
MEKPKIIKDNKKLNEKTIKIGKKLLKKGFIY